MGNLKWRSSEIETGLQRAIRKAYRSASQSQDTAIAISNMEKAALQEARANAGVLFAGFRPEDFDNLPEDTKEMMIINLADKSVEAVSSNSEINVHTIVLSSWFSKARACTLFRVLEVLDSLQETQIPATVIFQMPVGETRGFYDYAALFRLYPMVQITGLTVQAQGTGAAFPKKQEQKNIGRNLGIAVAAGIALIACAGIGLSLFGNRSSKPKKDSASSGTAVTTISETETEGDTSYYAKGDDGTYTLMIYMVGSNLESGAGVASADLQEILDSGLDFDKCNVLVYAGGSSYWAMGFPSTQNTIYRINASKDFEEVYSTASSENMGDTATFSQFLNFTCENYQADHYGLICWDHGAGPIGGFGNDELFYYDSLTLSELEQAMDATPFAGETKLDWIGFDACLMSSIEVADVWDKYADYLVASQETESGVGWDYSFLSVLNDTNDARTVTSRIIDTYRDYFVANETATFRPDATLACLDLSKTKDTVEAMDVLFSKMEDTMNNDGFNKLARLRDNTKRFGLESTGGKANGLDLIDLGDMAKQMEKEYPDEAAALKEDIQKMVIYQNANIDNCSGISIYYPYDNKLFYLVEGGALEYDQVSTSEHYKSYISGFTTSWLLSIFETGADWTLQPTSLNDQEMQLAMTQEQKENYSSAYYTILSKTEDGYYIPVLCDCKAEVDSEGVVHVLVEQQLFYMVTEEGKQSSVWGISQIEDNESKTSYSTRDTKVTGTTKAAENDEMAVFVSFAIDNNSNQLYLNGIESADLNTVHSGKNDIALEDLSTVSQQVVQYELSQDSEGNYLPYSDWTENGWATTEDINVENQNFGFERRSMEDDGKTYYCQITIQDTRGNIFGSDLQKLTK